jgi:uncharacterized protein with PIN domain
MTDRIFSFVAESTLGRLAKWLRLAGFDTIYDGSKPNAHRLAGYCYGEHRMILTRTASVQHALPTQQIIFIQADLPLNQARQVMRHLGLAYRDLRPLTVCAECNRPLVRLPKSELPHRVPDYTFRHHEQFHGCAECGRVYWPGTHVARWSVLMHKWFEE